MADKIYMATIGKPIEAMIPSGGRLGEVCSVSIVLYEKVWFSQMRKRKKVMKTWKRCGTGATACTQGVSICQFLCFWLAYSPDYGYLTRVQPT